MSETVPARRDRRVRQTAGRRVVLGAFALCAVALLGLGFVQPESATSAAAVVDQLPPTGAVDTAWYCADGTSNAGGRADQTLLIANRAASSASVTVDVAVAGKRTNASFVLDGLSSRRVRVSEIVAAPDPGVTVYARGGQVVVEHLLSGVNDIAIGPCARQPGASWYFAAGSTVKGAFEWLALYNPFPEGALIDIEVLTKDIDGESETSRPVERINSVNVPGYTRVTVPIHERIGRHTATALAVNARFGRIVAERSLVFDNVDGRSGLALSLGTPAPATRAVIAGGRAGDGRSEMLAVANPGVARASITVQFLLEGDLSIEPITQDLDPNTVTNIALPTAPSNRYRALSIASSVPVVSEVRVTSARPQVTGGLATVIGESVAQREQVFVASRATPSSTDHYVMVNSGGTPVDVRVRVSDASEPSVFTIGPSGVVEFDAIDVGATPTSSITFLSTGPIIVGRDTTATGITLSAGIGR